ncbi:MAG: phospholipid carrier-dependent glycosyltransferase, partial [Anaerolineales bacterium]|nr:phospholipid carrier-dependent glycosyltransferase [Anaerolineales bacterium]
MKTSKPSKLWEPTRLPTPSLGAIRTQLPGLLLVLILGLAVSLRLVGLNWDDSSHIHPDERFLTMVETSLRIPSSLGEYFDTSLSPLNPHNVGHGFFVYGTLPIFLVRIVAEWAGKTGYDEVNLVGRMISTFFDLISIYLVFLIGKRLYRRRVAFLAALFTALSVLLIQHAHFFVVDPAANTFILAGLYFAIKILDEGSWFDYLLFGLMLGMSVASKINAAPLAGLAALAGLVRIYRAEPPEMSRVLIRTTGYLVLAAVVSLLVFRVFQPYAFQGPSFFDVKLNPRWQANMAEIQSMNRGDTDAPYALQWADRPPIWFSFKNLVLWGLGLPLGLVAWASWAWAVWESLRGKWQRHVLLVVWTGAYFIWQSIGFTPAMRYQIPVYPTLTLLAAWGLWEAWDRADSVRQAWRKVAKITVGVVATVTILWTFIWALAFASIYTRPVTRVAGTRWIYTHIPAALNVVVGAEDERLLEPIALTLEATLASNRPYETSFKSDSEGFLAGVVLPNVRDLDPEVGTKTFTVEVMKAEAGGPTLGIQESQATLSTIEETTIEIRFDEPVEISTGEAYKLRLGMTSTGGIRF